MKTLLKLVVIAAVVISGLAMADEPNQETETLVQVADKLMAEEYRRSVKKIVVLPGGSPASGAVTGSYQKETDGLIDGVDKGAGIGVIRKDIGGIPISFPIPILTVPGMIFGGLSGSIKREIQDFRDALTDDLLHLFGSGAGIFHLYLHFTRGEFGEGIPSDIGQRQKPDGDKDQHDKVGGGGMS